MTLWEAILLGAVQGATEFLPVSSSGHLVLGEIWLGLRPSVAVGAALHFGTLLVVLFYYRRDLGRIFVGLARSVGGLGRGRGGGEIWREDHDTRLGLLVALGSVPTAIIGLGFKDYFKAAFASGLAVSCCLVATGGILLATRLRRSTEPAPGERPAVTIPAWVALVAGVAQGVAILPGISRSGMTIAVLLLLGAPRAEAARFSFLLSVPAILGALVLESGELIPGRAGFGPLLAGVLAAMVVGYVSLVFLVRLVERGGFHRFAYYVIPLGAGSGLYFLAR